MRYGSSAKLLALGEACFGLNIAFLINFLAAIVIWYFTISGALPLVVSLLAMFAIVFAATGMPCRKIAFAMGWPDWYGAAASVLMGLNAWGIVGYAVMQMIANKEVKKYGLKVGFFGPKRKNLQVAIQQIQQAETAPPPAPPVFDVRLFEVDITRGGTQNSH